MYKKYSKLLLVFIMLITFIFSNSLTVSASNNKDNSSTVKPKSKLNVKKKKLKTYTYKTVKSKTSSVPTATGPVKFKLSLSTAIPKIGANYSYDLGFTGAGSYVAIIDTGVEKSHPFLAGKVALEACFSSRCPNGQSQMIGAGAAAPVHYHGTHVAGIIAGSNASFHGIAPDAKIIAINVFDPYGGAYDGDIIKALNWINSIASEYNITSVNMSLGSNTIFKGTCDDYIPDMTTAVRNLKLKNIATVVSSGNSYAVGMSSPACISDAVSVAATSTVTDAVTDFSNVSQYTTLSAPGLQINSSKLMGSYGSASGTSMSAPFVTGAFAIYRSKFGVQTVDKAVSDLQKYSSPATDRYSGIITKRINMKSLIDQAVSVPIITTTTSTVASTTTTTLVSPTTTLVPPPSTTSSTTVPVSTSTTSTVVTTTIPGQTYNIGKPRLTSLDSYSTIWRSYTYDIFMVRYIDVSYGKTLLSHYLLTCNTGQKYVIPINISARFNSYRLKNSDGTFASAKGISSCYLQGAKDSFLGPKTWWESISK
jgi:subtilisin family serine protease